MFRPFTTILVLTLLAGCSGIGTIENTPLPAGGPPAPYSVKTAVLNRQNSADLVFYVAFSGGGTRAAALAYGALQELRDSTITIDGSQRRLLDEVDTISAVSGGSFTAAYYGLHGDKIFDDFETAFLRRDIEGELIRSLFNPINWLKFNQRSELAEDLYDRRIFHHATYADMRREHAPLIVINASDLSKGVRFSFVQEYFNLLCSDLSTFPVSRAVTASSAVPLLFQPVALKNYPGCDTASQHRAIDGDRRPTAADPQREYVVNGLKSYADKQERPYIHFVDGGITDNLGLRGMYEFVDIVGGAAAYTKRLGRKTPRRIVVLVVNASTEPKLTIDQNPGSPSLLTVINAVTDVQLQRYNAATLHTLQQSLQEWADELSTPEQAVTSYFIHISINEVAKPELRHFFNRVPTSFSLSGKQVDALIDAGHQLLRKNPEYRRLLADLGGDASTPPSPTADTKP